MLNIITLLILYVTRLKHILAKGDIIFPSTYIYEYDGKAVHDIHTIIAEANRLRAELSAQKPNMLVMSYSTIIYPHLAENLTFYSEVMK